MEALPVVRCAFAGLSGASTATLLEAAAAELGASLESSHLNNSNSNSNTSNDNTTADSSSTNSDSSNSSVVLRAVVRTPAGVSVAIEALVASAETLRRDLIVQLPQAIVLCFPFAEQSGKNQSANAVGAAEDVWREAVAAHEALRGSSVLLTGVRYVDEVADGSLRSRSVAAAARMAPVQGGGVQFVECIFPRADVDGHQSGLSRTSNGGAAALSPSGILAAAAGMVLDAAAAAFSPPAKLPAAHTSNRADSSGMLGRRLSSTNLKSVVAEEDAVNLAPSDPRLALKTPSILPDRSLLIAPDLLKTADPLVQAVPVDALKLSTKKVAILPHEQVGSTERSSDAERAATPTPTPTSAVPADHLTPDDPVREIAREAAVSGIPNVIVPEPKKSRLSAGEQLAGLLAEFRAAGPRATEAGPRLVRDILSVEALRFECMREFRLRNHTLILLLSERNTLKNLIDAVKDDTIDAGTRHSAAELLTADVPAILETICGGENADVYTALWPELFSFLERVPSAVSSDESDLFALSQASILLSARVAGFLLAMRSIEFMMFLQVRPHILTLIIERLGVNGALTTLLMEMLDAEQQLRAIGIDARVNDSRSSKGPRSSSSSSSSLGPKSASDAVSVPGSFEEDDAMPSGSTNVREAGFALGVSPTLSSSWMSTSVDTDADTDDMVDPVLIVSATLVPALSRLLRKVRLHQNDVFGKLKGSRKPTQFGFSQDVTTSPTMFISRAASLLGALCELCTQCVNKFPADSIVVRGIAGPKFSRASLELAFSGVVDDTLDVCRALPLTQPALELVLLLASLCANDTGRYETDTLPPLLDILSAPSLSQEMPLLRRMRSMLIRPPRGLPPTVETSAGVTAPLGVLRLRLLELVSLMLRCGYERVDAALMLHEVLPCSVDIFFQYRWNNIMHAVLLVAWKRVLTSTEPRRFPTILYLLREGNLFRRIIEVDRHHAQESHLRAAMDGRDHASARPVVGYMGHVSELAACVVLAASRHARMYYFLEDNSMRMAWDKLIRSLRERQQLLASSGIAAPVISPGAMLRSSGRGI